MNFAFWRTLAVTTVTDPASAARQIMAMEFPREVLWLALALAVVLNTTIQAAINVVFPPVDGMLPGVGTGLGAYAAIVGGGLILTIISLHRVGRWMGGQGTFNEVMALMVWMQFLRVVVQAASFVLLLTVPILSALLALAAALLGLYIFLHFIDQAHRLGSIWRAAGVLIVSVFAIAFVLFVLLSLAGAPITGSAAYV
ncbi:Yip1 family protein [Lutimaribacter marinistellae]|uniref:Yip1 family protein n=1 Tax=Lutimaribacter marinistellae TaxID=1820329 RepID=A0ABV7TMR6_9RHOB